MTRPVRAWTCVESIAEGNFNSSRGLTTSGHDDLGCHSVFECFGVGVHFVVTATFCTVLVMNRVTRRSLAPHVRGRMHSRVPIR